MKRSVTFRLSIPAEKYLAFYQGYAQEVVVHADNGQVVRFPAHVIKQFLQHEGIFGHFRLVFDEKNKFQEIKRIG